MKTKELSEREIFIGSGSGDSEFTGDAYMDIGESDFIW